MVVENFGSWADKIWENSKHNYNLIADRSKVSLNVLYPIDNKKFIKLKIFHKNNVIGWCVLLKTKLSKHKQFGNMLLGSIVDCLCLSGYEHHVIEIATKFLVEENVDLIVTNQSSKIICNSLISNSFISGPTNFALALSENIFVKLENYDGKVDKFHLNRGDGDGPINL